jgi:hypothetical protein
MYSLLQMNTNGVIGAKFPQEGGLRAKGELFMCINTKPLL